jgi:putative membrane-bound dehydrogenase-like protein
VPGIGNLRFDAQHPRLFVEGRTHPRQSPGVLVCLAVELHSSRLPHPHPARIALGNVGLQSKGIGANHRQHRSPSRQVLPDIGQSLLDDPGERGAQRGVRKLLFGNSVFSSPLRQNRLPFPGLLKRVQVAAPRHLELRLRPLQFLGRTDAVRLQFPNALEIALRLPKQRHRLPNRPGLLEIHRVVIALDRQSQTGPGLAQQRLGLVHAQFIVARFDLRDHLARLNRTSDIHRQRLESARGLHTQRGTVHGAQRPQGGDHPLHRTHADGGHLDGGRFTLGRSGLARVRTAPAPGQRQPGEKESGRATSRLWDGRASHGVRYPQSSGLALRVEAEQRTLCFDPLLGYLARVHPRVSVAPMLACALGARLLHPAPALAESPLPQSERLKSSPVLRHLKPNPLPAPPQSEAEQTLAQMHVDDGFRVTLVAAEPVVRQPVAFAFDDRGRLWIAEAFSYPTRRPPGEGLDRLIILEDADGDGKFETHKVFAEKLNLVSGFELGFGGVWVGAAPELLFIPDRNQDDVPDAPPMVLLDGFGFQDTHECLNSFHWGPDGWLYGIQGVFNFARIGQPGADQNHRRELRAGVWRYHPTRHEFEIFAHGGSNPWGLDHDERGQLFMTHCRSYWGRGGTTHVIQGGQFWNQANANYAPYIVADPPRDFPGFRNYLLASARYDHGAGGAGAPGTDAIYGGHSHVGTMIYLGDNWPDVFRGHLFTHNLHGHQINQQVQRPLGSGFDTVHAGKDHLFCTDPKYVAIDLQYGPDGAVYIIDWYDQQHCHNPNTERWDRGNGRVYRLQFDAAFKPAKVNLGVKSDVELVEVLEHKNAWYGRTARRLLQERAQERPLDAKALAALEKKRTRANRLEVQLLALWTSHGVGALSESALAVALRDPAPYVRAWAIQCAAERGPIDRTLADRLTTLAKEDPSPVVRLYLASAAQRVSKEIAWPMLEALARHSEDREDRNIPFLLWHSLATRFLEQPDRALAIAQSTLLPQLADWVYWYAATQDGPIAERAITTLDHLDGDALRRRLAGIWLALEPRANVAMPEAWKRVATTLYAHRDPRVRRDAERIASVLGDHSMHARLRGTLVDRGASRADRQHAFEVLGRAASVENLPAFLALLDDADFRRPTLDRLASFDSPEVPNALLRRFQDFTAEDRTAALNALTRRAGTAIALLDAVADGRLKRDQLSAFYVRQLSELKNSDVDRRVAATWGRIKPTPAEKQALIAKLEVIFNEAPLWAYDGGAGRQHFQKLCSPCHVLGQDGTRIGPELTGAGRNGIRYFLENIVDPNAVVGDDFQMTTVETKAGDVISGLVLNENASALTLRTTTAEQVVAKAQVTERIKGEMSLMPEGLLEQLSPREQIELLKYLTEH